MDFIDYFLNQSLSQEEISECQNKDLSFLEHAYGKNIRKKFLRKYRKDYERKCIEQKKDLKKFKPQFDLFFNNAKKALFIQQQYLVGKLLFIPKWVKSFFTLETFLSFMKTVPKQFSMPEFATSEMVLNFIFYCVSYGVSWPQYFLFFKEGRDILYNAFFKNELTSILSLAEAIYMVGVTKAYDEAVFRKEFYTAFPDVEKYILNDTSASGIYRSLALFLVGKISFTAFRAIVMKLSNEIQKKVSEEED